MNYIIKFVTYDYVYPLSPHVTNNKSNFPNFMLSNISKPTPKNLPI